MFHYDAWVRFLFGVALGALLVVAHGRLVHPSGPFPPPAPSVIDEEGLGPADFLSLARGAPAPTTAALMRETLRILDPFALVTPFVSISPGEAHLRSPGLSPIGLPYDPPGGDLPPGPRQIPELLRVPLGQIAPPPRPARTAGRANLHGLRILLDPGHFGGAWSQAEERHFVFGDGPPLREGDINWGTALLLADLLRQKGAEVLMSRAPPPTKAPVLPPKEALASAATLGEWMKRHYGHLQVVPWLLANPEQLRIFWMGVLAVPYRTDRSFYQELVLMDLRRRGRLTETLAPHLTLSIHHNTSRDPQLNRVVVFLPGSIMPGEAGPSERFYAFRRALQGDIPLLKSLAVDIAGRMAKLLNVPASQYPNRQNGQKVDIYPERGVFARNLAVLRRAVGPVLLLEGPCMNHPPEYRRLTRRDFVIDGRAYPNRIRAYAQAAFEGVVAHAEALREGQRQRSAKGELR